MSSVDITLLESLEICIERAKKSYDNHWIITEAVEDTALRKLDIPVNMDDHFDKVTGIEDHLFTEICICVNGSLAMQLYDSIADVTEGDVCLLFPGVPHAELPKKGNDYLAVWISINLNTLSLHLSGKDKADGLFYTIDGRTINSCLDYNPIVTGMKEEIQKKNRYYLEIVKLNVIKILISILREIGDPYAGRVENNSWKEVIVAQVQNYIEKNYNRSIRLSDISQELCISPNYINTIFKSIMGKTIIHYVEDFKVEKAKELLKSAVYSISNIAYELGYYDQYHFSKIFKKETGYTPTQFRKLIRQNL